MPRSRKIVENNTMKGLLTNFATEVLFFAQNQENNDALTLDEKIDILIEKYLGE